MAGYTTVTLFPVAEAARDLREFATRTVGTAEIEAKKARRKRLYALVLELEEKAR